MLHLDCNCTGRCPACVKACTVLATQACWKRTAGQGKGRCLAHEEGVVVRAADHALVRRAQLLRGLHRGCSHLQAPNEEPVFLLPGKQFYSLTSLQPSPPVCESAHALSAPLALPQHLSRPVSADVQQQGHLVAAGARRVLVDHFHRVPYPPPRSDLPPLSAQRSSDDRLSTLTPGLMALLGQPPQMSAAPHLLDRHPEAPAPH